MRKALFYAIKPGLYGPRIIAVTTERGGRWWGRDTRDDLGTHGRASDIKGRFDTEEQATAVRDQVQRIHDHFRNERRKMEAMSRRMHHAEDQCITEIIQSAPARQADVITIEVTSTSVSTAEFLKETRHDRIPEPRTD